MKQFISKLGKALGLLLTIVGGLVTAILVMVIVLGQISGWGLVLLAPFLIVLGILPLSIGGVSLYASGKIARDAVRDRFYQMLRLNTGRISLLGFSDATRLEPSVARQYLDAWARECDATFDVTDEGDIYYIFSRQPQSLPDGGIAFQILERVRRKMMV
jgi:hypothetical protein